MRDALCAMLESILQEAGWGRGEGGVGGLGGENGGCSEGVGQSSHRVMHTRGVVGMWEAPDYGDLEGSWEG